MMCFWTCRSAAHVTLTASQQAGFVQEMSQDKQCGAADGVLDVNQALPLDPSPTQIPVLKPQFPFCEVEGGPAAWVSGAEVGMPGLVSLGDRACVLVSAHTLY